MVAIGGLHGLAELVYDVEVSRTVSAFRGRTRSWRALDSLDIECSQSRFSSHAGVALECHAKRVAGYWSHIGFLGRR